MPSPQGLIDSKHAPRSARTGLGASIHAPPSYGANDNSTPSQSSTTTNLGSNNTYAVPKAPEFTFGQLPNSSNTGFGTPSSSTNSTTPSVTSQALTTHDEGAATVHVPSRQPLPRKDLRLTPVLIQPASILPGFTIDDVLAHSTGDGSSFSVDTLAAGIAQGCSVQALQGYLDAFPSWQLEVKALVKGKHPVLFYAADRNCVDCIRLLLDYGAEVNACDVDGMPALPWTIMRSRFTVVNPTEVVKMLLAFGAKAYAVPKDMWLNYLEAPSSRPPDDGEESEPAAAWCTSDHRQILASTLNLSIRYALHKASLLTTTKGRGMQLAQAHAFTALLKAPYLIIGQHFATNYVIDHVATHIAMKQKSPLVLTFAGLSGHGKTELAKQMGGLLQVPMTVIDCAQMHSDTALFGSRPGYQGNAQGSQLNNHLAEHSGMPSVVFMDEFDKTDKAVHNSLLLILDSGEYYDRRTNVAIDAKKTIWVMATNLGDVEIRRFYRKHLEGATAEEAASVQHEHLQEELKALFRTRFGAPIAGRMKNIAPFYPFNLSEQAVVAHKFLMELVDQVRQPIDTSELVKDYIGHIHLAVKNDGKLCAHVAEKSYIEDLGARSLASGIDDVRVSFYTTFADTHELVSEEINDGPLMRYTVQLQPLTSGGNGPAISKIRVGKDGYTSYSSGQVFEDEDEEMIDGFERMMGGEIA